MAGPRPEPFDVDFGRRVAEYRERCPERLSQERLAEWADMPVKAIRQIEAQTRPARLSEAAAIADALAVPLADLLGLGAPSDDQPIAEVRARLAEVERAIRENQAQREGAEAQLTRCRELIEHCTRRDTTLMSKWTDIRVELARRES